MLDEDLNSLEKIHDLAFFRFREYNNFVSPDNEGKTCVIIDALRNNNLVYFTVYLTIPKDRGLKGPRFLDIVLVEDISSVDYSSKDKKYEVWVGKVLSTTKLKPSNTSDYFSVECVLLASFDKELYDLFYKIKGE